MNDYFDDITYKGTNFTTKPLQKGDYEDCSFVACNFNKADFTSFTFINCIFENCDLSGIKVLETGFQEVQFVDCKMLGIHFEHCNSFLLSLDFNLCKLDYSSFYQQDITQSKFDSCSLREVDFSESKATGVLFDKCNFIDAKFEQTNLVKADFRTAINFVINPELNKINKAKFSKEGVIGLLTQYDLEVE